MRKLASIQRVVDISPIEGADRIETATVLGWQCVVKKGELTAGDMVVFFEIDSVLPEVQWCEFLGEHRRIKTRKFRGQISQGLALPLSTFPDLAGSEIGKDVSDALGVVKYEVPEKFKAGDMAGPFPSHLGILKTDEVRIQSEPGLLEEMSGQPYMVTEKIDGTSCTIVFSDELIVCSRNWAKKPGDNVYWKAVEKFGLERFVRSNTAVQCEIYGPGIQKNTYGAKELSLAVFDVFDLSSDTYIDHYDVAAYASALGLSAVSEVCSGVVFDLTLEEIESLSEGVYPNGHPREGIVVRPQGNIYSPTLGRKLSFKCVNKNYLLKVE